MKDFKAFRIAMKVFKAFRTAMQDFKAFKAFRIAMKDLKAFKAFQSFKSWTKKAFRAKTTACSFAQSFRINRKSFSTTENALNTT